MCGCGTLGLLSALCPQENAAKYFKKYTKAKTAEKYITAQLEKARVELTYLESVLQELTLAESEQDFNDIRAELTDGGYLRAKGRKQPQRPSKPREFRSTAGLRILVGRNNRQNDRLTAKDAEKWDIWLHTQRIHGSHVILCTGGAQPDEQSLLEAASLAAYFSQAQDGTKVPVDFTQVKYVKKPAGSPRKRPATSGCLCGAAGNLHCFRRTPHRRSWTSCSGASTRAASPCRLS